MPNVGKYTSPMDPMGIEIVPNKGGYSFIFRVVNVSSQWFWGMEVKTPKI